MQPVASFNTPLNNAQGIVAGASAGQPGTKASFDLLMAISLALDQFVAGPKLKSNENSNSLPAGMGEGDVPFKWPEIESPEPQALAKGDADMPALLIAGSPLAPLFEQPAVDPAHPASDVKAQPKPLPLGTGEAGQAPHRIVTPAQPDQTWNLRELAWQLRAAVRQIKPAGEGEVPANGRVNSLNGAVPAKNREPNGRTPLGEQPALKLPADPRFTPSPWPHLSQLGNVNSNSAENAAEFHENSFTRSPQGADMPEGGWGTARGMSLPAGAPQPEAPVMEFGPSTSIAEQLREVAETIADRAQGAIRVGDKGVEATMRLYPPDLGAVRVALTVLHDSTVQAQFVAERPETAALIQRHLPQLQEAFARQGLVVDRIQVAVPLMATAPGSESGASLLNQQSPEQRRFDFFQQQRRQQEQQQRQQGFQDLPG